MFWYNQLWFGLTGFNFQHWILINPSTVKDTNSWQIIISFLRLDNERKQIYKLNVKYILYSFYNLKFTQMTTVLQYQSIFSHLLFPP